MPAAQKTVIVTGASHGIGAGVVRAFLARGYNVLGTARKATKSEELAPSDHLSVIDGDIGQSKPRRKFQNSRLRGSVRSMVSSRMLAFSW